MKPTRPRRHARVHAHRHGDDERGFWQSLGHEVAKPLTIGGIEIDTWALVGLSLALGIGYGLVTLL